MSYLCSALQVISLAGGYLTEVSVGQFLEQAGLLVA